MRTKGLIGFVAGLALALAALVVPGCGYGIEEAERDAARMGDQATEVDASRVRLEAILADIEARTREAVERYQALLDRTEDEAQRAEIMAAIDAVRRAAHGDIASLEADIEQARAEAAVLRAGSARMLDAAQQAREIEAGPLGSLMELLPPGTREPALLATGAILGLMRSRKLKGALASVVQSFESAKRQDPQFAESFKRVAPVIRDRQSPLARAIVDATQGKAATLSAKLPV